MNLMVVSQKHGLLIIGVDHELFVYKLDPITLTLTDNQKYLRVNLKNDNVCTFIEQFHSS
jgi:hypothetical protein